MDWKKDLEEAEMVLIGLGNQFDNEWSDIEAQKLYLDAYDLLAPSKYSWILPGYREFLREKETDRKVHNALLNLADAIKQKNYYVVSETLHYAVNSLKWKDDRIVNPIGNLRKKQCKKCCKESIAEELSDQENDRLLECFERISEFMITQKENTKTKGFDGMPEDVVRAMHMMELQNKREEVASYLEKICGNCTSSCKHCGERSVYNTLYSENYAEDGYRRQWDRYTKWLGGTRNKRLLLIELGCDNVSYDVIRHPFEKMAELNHKAIIYRVNKEDAKLPEKLAEKGFEISENAIDWLTNL